MDRYKPGIAVRIAAAVMLVVFLLQLTELAQHNAVLWATVIAAPLFILTAVIDYVRHRRGRS